MRSNISILLLSAILLICGCSKNNNNPAVKAKTGTYTVNWFRDSTTPNPTAFIDLYNAKAYTMSQAALKADSVDLFCYDHSALAVSGQNISLVNMVFWDTGNYAAAASFQSVVGTQTFSTYNASTISEISMTSSEFAGIVYNADIDNLFTTKALNGGYTDIDIQASDISNTQKYYQFKCAKNGKKGFLHVTSSNYLPGGYMTIEEKLEQ